MSEPRITINGVQLDGAQAMTIRVAIASLLVELQDPDHLGADEHGRFMTKAYKARALELQAIMAGG